MNERLLELARQAGLKKDHASDREYMGDFDWREFSELIVKECISVVDQWKNEPFPLDADMMSKEIRKHFEIK
jgi:hypothetical protein